MAPSICPLAISRLPSSARSGPRPSADVPQLFLAIFRSFPLQPMFPTHASAWIFLSFCKCSIESSLSSLDAISPETNHRSVRGSPPGPRPRSNQDLKTIGFLRRLSSVTDCGGTMSLPAFSTFFFLLRYGHVVKTRFHLMAVSNKDSPGLYHPTPYLGLSLPAPDGQPADAHPHMQRGLYSRMT